MAGRFSLGTVVIESAGEALPKADRPQPVGQNPWHQRIFRLRQPVSQVEPRQPLGMFGWRELREKLGGEGFDDRARVVHPIAPRQHPHDPRLAGDGRWHPRLGVDDCLEGGLLVGQFLWIDRIGLFQLRDCHLEPGLFRSLIRRRHPHHLSPDAIAL